MLLLADDGRAMRIIILFVPGTGSPKTEHSTYDPLLRLNSMSLICLALDLLLKVLQMHREVGVKVNQ
jgi:hypothetical protein